MPPHIPIPVNNTRRAEFMWRTWICPAAVGSGFLGLLLLLIPHSPAEFQCPGSTAGASQSRGSLEGGEEEMRLPLAHWRGDGPAAGGDRGCFVPSYPMYSTAIFSFSLCAEKSVQLFKITLIWLIITLYLKYKHETVLQ